jgi:hypothetical protein
LALVKASLAPPARFRVFDSRRRAAGNFFTFDAAALRKYRAGLKTVRGIARFDITMPPPTGGTAFLPAGVLRSSVAIFPLCVH